MLLLESYLSGNVSGIQPGRDKITASVSLFVIEIDYSKICEDKKEERKIEEIQGNEILRIRVTEDPLIAQR